MLKTGIYKAEQMLGPVPMRQKISVTLYPVTASLLDGDAWAERILYHFSDERGAFKRTYESRFPAFDQDILAVLKDHFNPAEPLELHDVAVSDGRTAADFYDVLAPVFSALTYTASDYNPTLHILRKGRLTVTVNEKTDVLEILFPPFVFNVIHRDSYKFYPLNHLVRWGVQWLWVRPLVNAYRAGQVTAEKMYLFAPRVLALAEGTPHFILTQHDILTTLPRQAHVIRAMNVLNPAYFTADEFARVIGHLYDGLHDNGLLVTGSNEDAGSLVNGAVYKKTMQGFEKIWQSGQGSPVDEVISGHHPRAIAA